MQCSTIHWTIFPALRTGAVKSRPPSEVRGVFTAINRQRPGNLKWTEMIWLTILVWQVQDWEVSPWWGLSCCVIHPMAVSERSKEDKEKMGPNSTIL